jgi:hypothetical protein
MFWGCFSDLIDKRPDVFWEKAWGLINKEFYVKYIVSVIQAFIQ